MDWKARNYDRALAVNKMAGGASRRAGDELSQHFV